MTTPHIEAAAGAFADTVLLPGDPLRARHIATTLFDDAEQVTAVRGMLGFTGHYRGRRISVMGSGMGIPSLSIYANELIREYGVKRLVRVGTCGALHPQLAVGDIVLASGAGTDSRVNRLRFADLDFPATASFALLRCMAEQAERSGASVHVGNVFSTDLFYSPLAGLNTTLQSMGILAIEMEAAGLFGVAAANGAEAAAALTVSDHIVLGTAMTPEQRQNGIDPMVRLVLDAVCA